LLTIPIWAAGSWTSARVRNSIPSSVRTIDPARMVFEPPVFRLEKVTSPVAVVSVS
jgi:hypothetical protein